jgi:hypothetical protein
VVCWLPALCRLELVKGNAVGAHIKGIDGIPGIAGQQALAAGIKLHAGDGGLAAHAVVVAAAVGPQVAWGQAEAPRRWAAAAEAVVDACVWCTHHAHIVHAHCKTQHQKQVLSM